MNLVDNFQSFTSPPTLPARKPRLSTRSLYRSTRRRYTGKERDSETGLYYYGARYLDSKTGRWLSGDPAVSDYVPSAPVNDEARKRNGSLPGMGGVFNYANLHVYHYAGNNPVKYVDPDGKAAIAAVIPFIVKAAPIIKAALIYGAVTYGAWQASKVAADFAHSITEPETDNSVENAQQGQSLAGRAQAAAPAPSQPPQNNNDDDKKPELITNNKHHPNSRSPEPRNVNELYQNSVEAKDGTRWAKDSDGNLHRFNSPSNGQTHWNGSTAGDRPIRPNNIPPEIKRSFGVTD